jgi:rhodanese-related sulfurtransferase
MVRRLSTLIAVLVIASMILPGLAMAQEPTEDFETVRMAIEEWLATSPAPVITVDALFENLNDGDESNDPFVLSVRSPEHYELGHVPGAVNIPWRTIAKPESLEQLPTDQPIVDYCYTGHTGQVAMTALNLMGYDATNMKWGMMAWTKNDDVLGTTRFDPAAVPDYRVETEPNEATETYDFPALETGATGDDAEVIRTAIDNYLSSDKAPTISADALFENLNDGDESNDPVVLSVRKPEDYAKGHIPGAINIPWTQLGDPEMLAKLPPDKPIVTYCYTGHTGQIAATLLSVLGYDATNLKFGMMGWSKDPDVVATTVFDPATQADYRLEGTLADGGSMEEVAGMPAPALIETSEEEVGAYTWTFLTFKLGPINKVMAATAMEDGTIMQLSVTSPADPEMVMEMMMPALESLEGQ